MQNDRKNTKRSNYAKIVWPGVNYLSDNPNEFLTGSKTESKNTEPTTELHNAIVVIKNSF